MRLFLIAYDLVGSSPHKHAMATAIMNLGEAWARPLESTWYVRADTSEREIQNTLAGLLDVDDALIVQPVSEGAAMANTALRWFRRKKEDATSAIPSRTRRTLCSIRNLMPMSIGSVLRRGLQKGTRKQRL